MRNKNTIYGHDIVTLFHAGCDYSPFVAAMASLQSSSRPLQKIWHELKAADFTWIEDQWNKSDEKSTGCGTYCYSEGIVTIHNHWEICQPGL